MLSRHLMGKLNCGIRCNESCRSHDVNRDGEWLFPEQRRSGRFVSAVPEQRVRLRNDFDDCVPSSGLI